MTAYAHFADCKGNNLTVWECAVYPPRLTAAASMALKLRRQSTPESLGPETKAKPRLNRMHPIFTYSSICFLFATLLICSFVSKVQCIPPSFFSPSILFSPFPPSFSVVQLFPCSVGQWIIHATSNYNALAIMQLNIETNWLFERQLNKLLLYFVKLLIYSHP